MRKDFKRVPKDLSNLDTVLHVVIHFYGVVAAPGCISGAINIKENENSMFLVPTRLYFLDSLPLLFSKLWPSE